jgi:hypothetical protein
VVDTVCCSAGPFRTNSWISAICCLHYLPRASAWMAYREGQQRSHYLGFVRAAAAFVYRTFWFGGLGTRLFAESRVLPAKIEFSIVLFVASIANNSHTMAHPTKGKTHRHSRARALAAMGDATPSRAHSCGILNKASSGFPQSHGRSDCETVYDGLPSSTSCRTIDTSNHHDAAPAGADSRMMADPGVRIWILGQSSSP